MTKRGWFWWYATVGGIGYVPLAPGTVASIVAFVVGELFFAAGGRSFFLSGLAVSTLLAFFAVHKALRTVSEKDPSCIVIDEWISVWLLLLCIAPYPSSFHLLGLIFFRLFDIFKPFPVGFCEVLPGVWGVMIDDIVAALCAVGVIEFFF